MGTYSRIESQRRCRNQCSTIYKISKIYSNHDEFSSSWWMIPRAAYFSIQNYFYLCTNIVCYFLATPSPSRCDYVPISEFPNADLGCGGMPRDLPVGGASNICRSQLLFFCFLSKFVLCQEQNGQQSMNVLIVSTIAASCVPVPS